MSDEDGLDPAFRARLREALVTGARQERPRTRPAGARIALGVASAIGVITIGSVGATALPASAPAGGAAASAVDATCAAGPVAPPFSSPMPAGASSSLWGVTVTVTAPDEDMPGAILAACAGLWREGALVPVVEVEFQHQSGSAETTPESTGAQSADSGGGLSAPRTSAVEVPQLALCALPGGAPMVVPHVECADIRLPAWTAGPGR